MPRLMLYNRICRVEMRKPKKHPEHDRWALDRESNRTLTYYEEVLTSGGDVLLQSIWKKVIISCFNKVCLLSQSVKILKIYLKSLKIRWTLG